MHRRVARTGVLLLVLFAAVLPMSHAIGSSSRVLSVTDPVPGRYLVTLRDVAPSSVAATARALVGAASVDHVYTHALRGFAARMSASAAEALTRNPKVALVEQDGFVRAVATQTSPPWGLDRIDQRARPIDGGYTYNSTGSGVRAYIIDTGIRTSHTDFGGRASIGTDTVGDGQNGADCNGHGTHVAGTVGGTLYGVAKQVSLVAVRVLDCDGGGTWAGVAAGVDWVTGNAARPAVANMSLGGGKNSTVDTAVANSIASGITYAIAAGNGDFWGRAQDACTTSPANVPAALTVSATDTTDTKASWANYGTCVDIFAPGVNVKSAWSTGDSNTNTISGTSMAAPHVAGGAALYLSLNTSATPSQVASALITNSTTGLVANAGSGSPNRLEYVGFIGTGEPPPPPPTVTAPASLSVSISSKGKTRKANLTWNDGAANVDVYRNGTVVAAGITNTGSYSDNLGRSTGTFTWKVCNAGTTSCSNEDTEVVSSSR
jgi:subtilisin family serine protease